MIREVGTKRKRVLQKRGISVRYIRSTVRGKSRYTWDRPDSVATIDTNATQQEFDMHTTTTLTPEEMAAEIAEMTGERQHVLGCRYGEFTRTIDADGNAETYPCTYPSLSIPAPEPDTNCPECGIPSHGLCATCQSLRDESWRLNHQYPFNGR